MRAARAGTTRAGVSHSLRAATRATRGAGEGASAAVGRAPRISNRSGLGSPLRFRAARHLTANAAGARAR
ncbi:hypothetical protein QE392_000428 [Microbacterium proteolyticum]|nr:hypothetical protein [Microbacterium sp. SORGH_AS_0344]MDQ1168624.1 hypothetical protein [Microbacterium proteolyticum]